jgi:prepilin-type N-terminal cleavage/methylation domain-containing protein
MNPRAAIPCFRLASGFTLIEIMVVIAIMGLILAMGIPSMFRMAEKDSMRQVLIDIREACVAARAEAILSGQTQTMTMHPVERTFSAAGKNYSIPKRFGISIIGVNNVSVDDFATAPVRFFPNGTSDMFFIGIQSGHVQRFIYLDCVTSLPEVENEETMRVRLERLDRFK